YLPNWAHDALLEYSSSKPQDHCSTEVPEGSGNPDSTASTSNPPADQMETLTVETLIPTVSSLVLTAYFPDSQEPSKPKKISDALQYLSWVEAIQEELLKFKIQNVWTLVDYPKGWQLSSLAVRTSSANGNSITGSGNALCILFPTILP
nr:ribonuclease H-like domain-containing protein [Tanacetum cinerariifolium]